MYVVRMISRRTFLQTLSAAAVMGPQAAHAAAWTRPPRLAAVVRQARGSFALDGDTTRFFSPAIRGPVRIKVIADTHLFLDDERGAPFREYSARMARAYNQTVHVRTGAPTDPAASFDAALNDAREQRVDLIVLAGDIFSFPSEAAVEWALQRLRACGVPFVFTAGNHDWHYEGMAGTIEDLRREWTGRRLSPLYQGQDPLMAARDVNGLRVVTLDNSTYGIQPQQLDFYRAQAASGVPLLLVMHIPLFAPGRPVNFGCGHPDWGAAADKNADLERRPRWPAAGHTTTTRTFHQEVFTTPNLLGVIAGHIHKPSLDVVAGIPQVVVAANAQGGHLDVEVAPYAP